MSCEGWIVAEIKLVPATAGLFDCAKPGFGRVWSTCAKCGFKVAT